MKMIASPKTEIHGIPTKISPASFPPPPTHTRTPLFSLKTSKNQENREKGQKSGYYLTTALDRRWTGTGKVSVFITTPRHMTTDCHAHFVPHNAGESCAKKITKMLDTAKLGVSIIPQPAARSPQPAARSPQPAARSPQPAA
ncbi:MAG: hypothetical protein LBK99_12125, partial [Opitutaceae bacterium]|nr:hypothetical protein [Opitutaceae bacterium]